MIEAQRPKRRPRSELSTDTFRALLAALDDDLEAAARRYLGLHTRLRKFFEGRACLNSPELADEALNRLACRIVEGEVIENLTAYLFGVARHIVREDNGRRERKWVSLDELKIGEHPDTPSPELDPLGDEAGMTERRLQRLEESMQNLPAASRQLLIDYYREDSGHRIGQRRAMASRLGITTNALKIRVHRLRTLVEKEFHRHHEDDDGIDFT